MPIIRDSLETRSKHNVVRRHSPGRSTEDNVEPPLSSSEAYDASNVGSQAAPEQAQRTESRQELIARIKRDQRPIWLQNTRQLPDNALARPPQPPTLLPPAELQIATPKTTAAQPNPREIASNIERPKSALHAGDFHEQQSLGDITEQSFNLHQQGVSGWTSTSPTDPWYSPAFSVPLRQPLFEGANALNSRPIPSQARNRAVSQTSLSSSFIIRSPTSPLAQASETNDYEDRGTERSRSRSPTKSSRRHTFSPRSLRASQYSPPQQLSSFATGRPVSFMRREETEPYQSRDHRRSFAALSHAQHYSSPQTPVSRSRRASLLSDGSPLQAPLVGGYEESILRGRMSTLPSRPLDFVAQIGVLGKGECKKSLRCPAHISIPFPAVYYNYGNAREGTSTLDGPSPYVGLIDMEGFSGEAHENGSNGSQAPETPGSEMESNGVDYGLEMGDNGSEHHNSQRKQRYRLHGSTTSKKAPKGGYRIPQQGQLQIIIKNPNKTAVKLFLIAYDLAGMEPGQKTFIRQRSYSAGPIIDMPLNPQANPGSERSETTTIFADAKDRPVLRYLIHLHICCPSRGRFYLYKSIRVVFANRVPDGKEKLRNEIQYPEPRYSTFKPNTDTRPAQRSGRKMSSPAQPMLIDQGPPSLPNTNADPGCNLKLSYGASEFGMGRLPFESQIMSFQRKVLPTATPESTANGLDSSLSSDPMQVDSPPADLHGGRSYNYSPMAAEQSTTDPVFDSLDFNGVNKASGHLKQTGSRDHSPSPRSGLLSLQLRDLARNGASHGID